MFQGSIVAIVSPMHEDGSLDLESYRKLIDWHIASGTSAIVAVGKPEAVRASSSDALISSNTGE